MHEQPSAAEAGDDFSLMLGGPLYQLYLRMRLVRPSLELVKRRIVACTAITWLPLVVLTALAGTLAGRVEVPFLCDLDAQVRFLFALPLLIAAEPVVHRRVQVVVKEFVERGLIAPADRPRYEDIIAGTIRLRNSVAAEVLLLVFSWTAGYWLWRAKVTLHVTSWYALPGAGSYSLTWAGYWYAFVSLPIGRFLLLRWYFRLLIWYSFLWRVSRLRLRLNPLHPDRAGGLGFLEHTIIAFSLVLIAQSAFLSGVIGNQIWHAGATLPEFKWEILGFTAFLLLLVLLPLSFFAAQMVGAGLNASREFGTLASRYAAEFRQKWLVEGGARRILARQRRHPVAGRPGEQL